MLEASNLSFAYNAGSPDEIVALRDVSLQARPGELVAVIGHNGSGKSTLAKLMAAVMLPTSGAISVDGLAAGPATLWEIRRRVGLVFQRPDDQLVANTVIDDVAFGPENLGLPRDEIEQRVRTVLEALGLGALAHSQISELSGGEKQRVAIAGVLAMQPSYVILDEPTTMIAPARARQLLELVRQLRDRVGLAVVHITHFMHEVTGFDRIVVMDAGRVLMDGAPREIFARADELRAVGLNVPQVTELGRRLLARGVKVPEVVLTVGELAQALSAHQGSGVRVLKPEAQEPEAQVDGRPLAPDPRSLIEARDLHYTYMAGTPMAQEALRGVSCQVYAGETLALLGATQAGKSTLIEFLNGLRRAGPGHVFFEGQDVAGHDFDIQRMRDAVGIVFQQPETQLLEETVGKDVSFVPRRKKLPPAESRAIVERVLTEVGLDYETFRLRYIYALSGGQKRRVAIAGVLAAGPRAIILDEPVAGLDPRGRDELATLIRDLTQRQRLTVVLVGNAIDELAELADRAIVLHDGQVAMQGPLRELLRRADELHALGLELSEPAEIALALRPIFHDLPTDLLRLDDLERALLERLIVRA
jgi:energy-coupling factor transport system ATP-binding protein